MNTKNGVESIPPFIERPITSEATPMSDDRGTMSQATMIFGLAALTISMLGGGIFIYNVFDNGLASNLGGTLAKIVPVALAYAVGWVLCLLSVRSFSNLVLPLILKYYSWLTLTAVLVLYLKIMQKLFSQGYDLGHFLAYNVILFTGLAGLIGLHLLLDEHDLRRYSIPIIVISILHLILMVLRYVIIDGSNPLYLFGDLYFFLVMFALAALMLAHLGILNPVRRMIDAFFQPLAEARTAI